MLVKNIWIALLSVLFFSGIIVWQLYHLKEMKALKEEVFQKQAKLILHDVATALKTHTEWGEKGFGCSSLTSEMETSFYKAMDSLLLVYFNGEQIGWGIVEEEGDILISNISESQHEILKKSSLQTCLSCLVTISFVDKEGGMVIDQSLGHIRKMFGENEQDIFFLNIFRQENNPIQWPDYLVFVLVIGLSVLFAVSIYLNSRQKKLIEQKNEFINHLSHQFKTPLASIRLGTNMLLSREEFKNNKMLQVIHLEGNRLDKHIQTVLQWVRSGAQGLQLTLMPQDVVTITRHAIKQMEHIFRAEGIVIQTDFKEAKTQALVDEYHLTLVYFNLWENAVKHNPAPLQLKITVLKQGKFIVVKHEDNGRGLYMNGSNKNNHFTGLGLPYVKKVMNAHGGSMEFQSIEGEGTTVILQLPELKQ